ncbi:MAG: hypothetical protein PGN11_11805 [Quadrisphaera sp.]
MHVTSGGTEIVCTTQTARVLGADSLLLGVLPRSRRVVDVTAHQLLHLFHAGPDSPLLKWGALDDAQVAALVAQRPPVEATDDVVVLDDVDRALLRLLAVDGRTRVEDLSANHGRAAHHGAPADRRAAPQRSALLRRGVRLPPLRHRCTDHRVGEGGAARPRGPPARGWLRCPPRRSPLSSPVPATSTACSPRRRAPSSTGCSAGRWRSFRG